MSSETARRRSWKRRQWQPIVLIILLVIILVFRITQDGREQLKSGPTHSSWSVELKDDEQQQSMAYRDSLGFFDDNWSDEDWMLRKILTYNRVHNLYPSDPTMHAERPTSWYQENWDPDFACAYEDKIGSVGDGHKWICDPHRLSKKHDCTVYSVGSNGDFSFEVGLQERLPNCQVHIFDLQDYSQDKPRGLKAQFHVWGLKPSYDTNVTGWDTRFATQPWLDPARKIDKFKTLQETMAELGHKAIDVFKIDCEGCEWQSYQDWIQADLRQLLVEVHDSPAPVVNDFFQGIHHAGYVMFHKEPNIQFSNGRCQEIGFLKMAKTFLSTS